MNKDLDYIAKYLSDDLSSTNLYDIDSVRIKLRASLQILIENSIKTKAVESLREKTKQHIRRGDIKDFEVKFWKRIVNGLLIDKSEMNKYYEQLDSDLEAVF